MKLATALQIAASAGQGLSTRDIYLACGFTPLHLRTYLTAHLQLAYPDSRIRVATGLYGDLPGNLARIGLGTPAAVIIEWQDLDPRLGFRSLGGWAANAGEDVLRSVKVRLDVLAQQLQKVSRSSMLTVVLPGAPMAPISFTPPWLADRLSLGLHKHLAEFAAAIAEFDSVRLLNTDTLASFDGPRFQLKSELENGFPYSLAYADFLAEKIVMSVVGPQPKKGLITDLDDTLWSGILGDDGFEGVHWTLEDGAQIYGLYQQLLASLAETGVLIGLASKNDSAMVEEAFSRLTLAVRHERIFPKVVNWGRKSHSVAAILKAWNIGPQDVVFIDDSPTELEEVRKSFPELTCIQFKGEDARYSYELLLQLRSLFGKVRLEKEDAVRTATLKAAEDLRDERESADSEDDFLAGLNATIIMNMESTFAAGRALDLVNKTNQFNLNGHRYELSDWVALGSQPGRSLLVVEYLDKHGSLGRISVLAGVRSGDSFHVDTWVISCRAFARRIEYATLAFVFRRFDLRTLELAYEPTTRNGPLRDFLHQICGRIDGGIVKIDRVGYLEKCPPLLHGIREYP